MVITEVPVMSGSTPISPGTKTPASNRGRADDRCRVLIFADRSAGIGSVRGSRWLPGFEGPFPPPLWMSQSSVVASTIRDRGAVVNAVSLYGDTPEPVAGAG